VDKIYSLRAGLGVGSVLPRRREANAVLLKYHLFNKWRYVIIPILPKFSATDGGVCSC
jgi:hypothetical protein